MRTLGLAILLLSPLVLADVGWRQGTGSATMVRDISCRNDGGLWCSRDGGTSIGGLSCVGATATETGCVTPNAQTYAGTKTFTGDLRLVGHAHASLTACTLSGTWQNCTTHNAPVYCNGTTNIEITGSTSLVSLPPINVNGLMHSGLLYLSAWQLPFAYTVTGFSGFVSAGAGTTQTLRFTDGTNNCDCSINCGTGGSSFTCSGNCTYAASTLVVSSITSDGCTTPTLVKGILTPAGYRL